MARRLAIVLGVLLLLGGFSAYLVSMLQEHAAECDSTLRHCAVEREEIAFLEGEWCAAIDPNALRERFAFEDGRVLTMQEGTLLSSPGEWREARFFASMGEVIYFEHDQLTGERVSGEMTIRPDGPDARSTVIGTRRIDWIRCATG